VSLSLSQVPRGQAVQKLAEQAGWGVLLRSPSSAEQIDLHVEDQPADQVLELLLSDGRYLATRQGTLISIRPDDAPARPEPAEPESSAAATPSASAQPPPALAATASVKTPPEPSGSASAAPSSSATADEREPESKRGEDRFVTVGSDRVGADEVVHDLVVMGGAVEVEGTVTGDLTVLGGSATVRSGAEVLGDAVAIGGSLDIEDGAHVAGDVGVVGGSLRRGEKARVGGRSTEIHRDEGHDGRALGFARHLGGAITNTALLFVLGVVLIALGGRRMRVLQVEVASRPARSFALGIVGVLAAVAITVALCITVIGIPVAIIGVLLAVFAAYAGICAVLAAVGAALTRHRSPSPYVHLAVGCLVYLLLGWIPYVGGFFTAAVVLAGIGVLVSTRLGRQSAATRQN